MKDNRDIMREEIRLRLESDSWDFSIAHKVMEARNAQNENSSGIWSFASLATAAMSFIIFMASVYTYNNSTYKGTGSIYSYAYINNDNNLDNDILAAKVELTINEAFPMR